jgi:hypothetical protein
MRAAANERIDLLMRVTGTSNAQLARALSFDASYISRIRSGKRGLPRERSFIEPAASFFARNVVNSLQADTLAREMGVPEGWPDDEREVERLIAAWLVGERGLEPSGDTGLSVEGETDGIEREGEEGKSSNIRLFFGDEGRRQAALAFLDQIAHRGGPTELLLQSDEDIAWMNADPSFVDVWTRLMAGLAQAGCTFTVVHTVSRDGGEMWEGVREWLPLYLSGTTRPYYYPRLRDGVRKRSLFVARGTCAVVANSVVGMEGDVLSMMLADGDAVLALEREFDAYLALCRPLAETLRPEQGASFSEAITQFQANDSVAAEVYGAVVCVHAGHDALVVCPTETPVVYRVDEPRLVDALVLYIERLSNKVCDPDKIGELLRRALPEKQLACNKGM